MSTDDYQYLTSSGVIVADTDDILTEVQQEYIAQLGADLNVAPSTPQGGLITAETLARSNVVRNNAAVANQINPNIAGGIFLEALCALTGFDVPEGTPSSIAGVVLGGVGGTNVPAGQTATVGTGDDVPTFVSVSPVTLGTMTGTAIVDFQAVAVGPIAAGVNSLVLSNPVLGLETISNPNAAVLGVDPLSDAEIRTLRDNTLALQGISINEAIISALLDPDTTPGVSSLQYLENYTATTTTIQGITLEPNSIWACIAGGIDADIAMTLLGGKTIGANWNGDESVTVTDPSSGQPYTVLFDRPSQVTIYIRLTVTPPSSLANPQTAIANAALLYTQGQAVVGGATLPGFAVGVDASPFDIAGGTAGQIPGLLISKCEVSPDGSSWQTTEYAISINQQAVSTFSTITVVLP